MPQMLPRPYSCLAKVISIVLAGIILLLLSGVPTPAEQPQRADRPAKATPKLSGSRAAGAYWAEPWQAGGPKILDTRRSAPPAIQMVRPSATGSPRSVEVARPIASRPALYADRYWLVTRLREFYGYSLFYPRTLYGPKPLGQRTFRGGIPVGRGYISAGRPGFHGRGFRGRGFRGR